MKNSVLLLLILAIVLSTTVGCYSFNHRVGNGGSGRYTQDEGAWFILWGLVPLGKVDTQRLARGATDYSITTEFSFLDCVISFFTSIVTIYKQTVTVET